MDPHHTARLLAIGRIVLGAVLVVGPGIATRTIGVESTPRTLTMLARTTGVRDLVLGVGAFASLAEGRDAARWVRMGAVADGVDAVAIGLAGREIGGAAAIGGGVIAAAAAVIGVRTADLIGE